MPVCTNRQERVDIQIVVGMIRNKENVPVGGDTNPLEVSSRL